MSPLYLLWINLGLKSSVIDLLMRYVGDTYHVGIYRLGIYLLYSYILLYLYLLYIIYGVHIILGNSTPN